MQISDKEKSIIENLFIRYTEDFPLIYNDFFNHNRDREKSMYLTIDYISTDICDTIHDNILTGFYKKEDIPNLAFITYKEMYSLVSEKLKKSSHGR